MAKAQATAADAQAMHLPERIDHEWLREQAIRPREARIEALTRDRHQHISDLFVALRDKARPNEFQAGVRGRKRRKLAADGPAGTEEPEGSEDFARRYQDAQALRELDLSVPPLSPTPPPKSPTRTTPNLMPASGSEAKAEEDADADAEGEDEDEEMAVAEALAPSSSTAANRGASHPKAPSAAPVVEKAPTSSPAKATATQPSVAAPSSTAAAQAPANPTPATSSAGQTAIAAPKLSTTDAPAAGSSTPQPPITASTSYAPPPPYTSVFGIPEISSDYVDHLPAVSNEILRNRLNTSLALRTNTKKSSKTASTTSSSTQLVQPDLYKLHVRAQHMGAQNFVGPGKRVHNALSTHEWEVGLEEMKSIRVFERIEQLKADKKWSFRQPKKQRTGVVPKAHWDYLLDEMRWLQTDFRQESRSKVVTAHRLARACRAWHRASPDVRPTLCVRTRPPRYLDERPDGAQEAMDVDQTSRSGKGKEKELPDSTEEDADGEIDAEGEAEDAGAVDTVVGADGTEAPTTTLGPAPAGAGQAGGTGGDEKTLDPNKGSVSRSQQVQHETTKAHTQAQHIQALINFRNPIFDFGADETVVDYDLLVALLDAQASGELSDEGLNIAELDLAALFPDLPLYSDFILADDTNMARRVEESSAWMGRLANVTRLLESKPLLVSTLQPGRTRTSNGWAPETASLLEDIEPPVDPRDQVPNASSVLFAGRKPKDVSVGEVLVKPTPVPHPDVRASSILWLPEEDARLLHLQKQYGFNWPLIAEIFNTSTQRPRSDFRLPWDCYDRWDRLVGPGSKKVLPDGTEISVPAPEYIPPVDRMGRAIPVIGNGDKKSARHASIADAIKKVQKLRELTASKAPPPGFPRRINMSMHESHNLPPRPYWTPMEWSVYKADQELQKARQRQAQAQAAQQAQQQAQQQQQQQAAAAAAAAQQNGGQRYQGPVAGSFANGSQGPRVPSSLPAQMAAAAAAAQIRGSPNGGGSPSALPLPNPNLGSSPSPGPAQLANGAGGAAGSGPTNQLTPEQLQLLQQRQQAFVAAQAQARLQQQQVARQGGGGGAGNGE
ncbi:hypothetical protein JCM10212_004636 [Sporobolomyces blumeae]